MGSYNWVSFTDLSRDVAELSGRLPRDLAGVIGVPRSGMIPASMLAVRLHCHLADSDSFAATGGFYGAGSRMAKKPQPAGGKVLLIDDAVRQGTSIKAAMERIAASAVCRPFRVLTCGMYTIAAAKNWDWLDYVGRIVRVRRVFEWNFTSHPGTNHWGWDMDGVICPDPSKPEEDEAAYVKHLTGAPSLHLPRCNIYAVVTGRLKKWREHTAQWLADHGLANRRWLRRQGITLEDWKAGGGRFYRKLIMYPAETAQERRRDKGIGQWKGEVFCDLKCNLFVESDPRQAEAIHAISGKQVLCTRTMQMVPTRKGEKR
jgi:hypoxanthine phosphoribosyltransferase